MKGNQVNSTNPATFATDLGEAHKEENKLKEWFEGKYDCVATTTQDKGSFPGYDLSVHFNETNEDVTIEVKMDKKVATTGNIAVEFQRTLKNGTVKPTCINATTADVWVYIFHGRYHFIETVSLKQMIQDKLYTRIVNGAGDGDRASCYLFPVDVFKSYCDIVKP
ncbi:MAG: hypothetical protein ACJ749_03855 [Flavisolibacter sp.]